LVQTTSVGFQELEQERKDAEEAKRKARQKSLLGFLQSANGIGDTGDEGSIEISLAGLFKCIFCVHPKSVDDKTQLLRIAESLDNLGKRMDGIERLVSIPYSPCYSTHPYIVRTRVFEAKK